MDGWMDGWMWRVADRPIKKLGRKNNLGSVCVKSGNHMKKYKSRSVEKEGVSGRQRESGHCLTTVFFDFLAQISCRVVPEYFRSENNHPNIIKT